GGLFVKDWSRGTQNLLDRVPEPHTDFIFSVIGEEIGFLGSSFVLLLYFVLLLCGIGIARRTREPCGRLIAMGVVTMFAIQVMVNVGMTIGIAPITGMTLPFISYGGSSLVASFLALSLAMNVAMRRTPVLAAGDFEFNDENS
ncbi:MAG: rod shape-determining protein RodA, partial [Planctomycetes bacterium]|nr:rod shape-determining protein RodA [Planctomycetota bacterium]